MYRSCLVLMNCSLLAFLFSHPTPPHRAFQVIVEYLLVVISEKPLRFGEVLFRLSTYSCGKSPPGEGGRRFPQENMPTSKSTLPKQKRLPVDNDQRALQVLVYIVFAGHHLRGACLFRQGALHKMRMLLLRENAFLGGCRSTYKF